MEFNKVWQEELKRMVEDEFGINAEGYKNGRTIETKTRCFPREQNPFTEINSTLLIPEKYFQRFMTNAVRNGGVRGYVNYLLFKYRIHIANGLVPAYQNHTTKYQEKNQNLVKVSFRPVLDDWAELKLYRLSFGMSISAFLIYLLIADFVDFAPKLSHFLAAVGIPQSPNLDLSVKVYLSRNKSHYHTVFQYKKSNYG